MLTRSGPLNIILTLGGTNGYDDLRRRATREPLGSACARARLA
jgi:hypothetical protein